ncbi:BLUF domain-containing protein [Paracoccus sp. M683]|uniref:BLUF domain-containing protein n=1 Tax=Paracoccus sp. M683 TaxID=2594268 RepID=UPI00163D4BC2|nr:BLUF domain-containing protein [Paracoccus sp. M683]
MISDPLAVHGADDGDLTHFLYRSNAREGLGQDDIDSIIAQARIRNDQSGLTGCLHFEDGLFFQWLEGPRAPLDAVIRLIRSDPRHSDIADLSYGPLKRRHFADWQMRVTNRDSGSLMDWVASNEVSTIDRGAYAGTVSAFLVAISR